MTQPDPTTEAPAAFTVEQEARIHAAGLLAPVLHDRMARANNTKSLKEEIGAFIDAAHDLANFLHSGAKPQTDQ